MVKKDKLLDRVWDVNRVKIFSFRTEKVYVHSINRYILFQRNEMSVRVPIYGRLRGHSTPT